MKISPEAKLTADNTKNAISAKAYGSWEGVAEMLLRKGFTQSEAEAIMRSKWTRWARDASFKDYAYGRYPAKVVGDYIDNMVRECGLTYMAKRVLEMTAES